MIASDKGGPAFDFYQLFVSLVNIVPRDRNRHYVTVGLAAEVGELLSVIVKPLRDSIDGEPDRAAITKELGDILWFISAVAEAYGIKLHDVVKANVDKLISRWERDVISGSGDNR